MHDLVARLTDCPRWREFSPGPARCFWWATNRKGPWLWHCEHEMVCVRCGESVAGRFSGLGRDGCPDVAPRCPENTRLRPAGWCEQ